LKLAYPIATPDASGPLMSFYGNFEKNISDIKSIGYDALELFVRDPSKMDVPYILKLFKKLNNNFPKPPKIQKILDKLLA